MMIVILIRIMKIMMIVVSMSDVFVHHMFMEMGITSTSR